jgi:hypothetical protein
MLSVLEGIENYPLIRTPGREYLLLVGGLEALRRYADIHIMGPNIWWPDDRAWCVATEVDLDSTYVGGSAGCIRSLLDHPALEAFPSELADRVDWHSDTINT